jgi:hypothetical protein
MTTTLVPVLGDNEAQVNITYGGQNGNLPDPVYFDSTDDQVFSWVTEAVQTGGVPGLTATNADFSDFVIERFQPNEERPFKLILVRPKTPFGDGR